MKTLRLLLPIAVIGAVAVGGAVTGSTLARWRDTATMSGTTVTAGSLSFTATGPGSTALPALGGMSRGAPRAVEMELGNSSPGGARNLRLEIRPAGYTHTNPGMNLDVEVRALTAGEQCSTGLTGFAPFKAPAWPAAGPALTPPLAPQQHARACLRVTVDSATGSLRSSTVTLDFDAVQVRP
jgi:hypothetical protein